ncbi:hypothetical protein [Polynucleobacter sp. JS-Safj-400b-B2]|uniref:hypothetical protein n=1 Tax=Polynucleobacter sp. JS-Safj-400b-B2 TaxID=2576921 RepID=UPI00210586C0|nr:hypothetical protein [Polynucleobacter sp. JS-Safj-400b-B2]
MKAILEDFLLEVSVKDPVDAGEHSAMLIAAAALLRADPNLKSDVFFMNNLVSGYRKRDAGRGVNSAHPFAPINQYFSQSANGVNDRSFCSDSRVSLQLRRFDLGKMQRDKSNADILGVTWFALHFPSQLKKDLTIEVRN